MHRKRRPVRYFTFGTTGGGMKGKSILPDFYNLYLRSEWVDICYGFKVPLPPDKEEWLRVIDFFKNHAPHALRKLTEKERKRLRECFAGVKELGEENQRHLEVSRRLHELTKKSKNETFPKEFFDATTLDGYKTIIGESWFCSESYGYFAEEYRHIKVLIDTYLDGYIAIESFMWLEERKKKHSDITDAFIVKNDDNTMCWPEILAQEGKLRVSLDEYSLMWLSYREEEWCPIKKRLWDLFHQIYTETTMVLQGKMEIKRCAAEATPKTPACQNIFIPQRKGALYCSTRCKNRMHQAKLNAERKEALAGIHKRRRKNVYKP